MAKTRSVVAAALALLVVMAMAFEAQAQNCPSVLSLIDCRPAVTAMNVRPSFKCCQEIKSVQNSGPYGPLCLCRALTSPIAKSLGVIQSQALQMPLRCGLQFKRYVCDGKPVPGGQ